MTILRRHETEAGVVMELDVFYYQQCVGFKMGVIWPSLVRHVSKG